MKRDDIYYAALVARDSRFDGKFFTGVKTTGIYCRPICPARPKRENVVFFSNYHEAERAGFRPCLRCRPESAPLSPAWVGKTAVVQRAIKLLHSQETIDFNEDKFADIFGVSARHLRRLFIDEIGKTPKQISFENRLNLSRKLIVETKIPMTEVAFAAGFSSIRRFNDAFKDRFKKTPSALRQSKDIKKNEMKLSLPYRPPFDFEGLYNSYQNHRIGNLEWFSNGTMTRVIAMNGHVGTVTISNDSENSQLLMVIDFPDSTAIHAIISKVRHLFDLSGDPAIIANSLESNQKIKKILKSYPGIRLPSGWDPFEIAISAILGQLVSVDFGRSLVYDLIELLGKDTGLVIDGKKVKLFPTPKDIYQADLTTLKTTSIRKQTLKDFTKALLDKRINLEPTQDVTAFIKNVLSIRGIGPWTANYMALKVLRDTDTFPGTDLILARSLEIHSQEIIDQMAPWRGYVAALFWRHYTQTLKKTKKVRK